MNFEAKLLNGSTTQSHCDHRKIRDRGSRRQSQELMPSLELGSVGKGKMEEGPGCCGRLTCPKMRFWKSRTRESQSARQRQGHGLSGWKQRTATAKHGPSSIRRPGSHVWEEDESGEVERVGWCGAV